MFETGRLFNFHLFQPQLFSMFSFHKIKQGRKNIALVSYRVSTIFLFFLAVGEGGSRGGGAGGAYSATLGAYSLFWHNHQDGRFFDECGKQKLLVSLQKKLLLFAVTKFTNFATVQHIAKFSCRFKFAQF